MSKPSEFSEISQPEPPLATSGEPAAPTFVKLAMRNMVRKGGTSLFHFMLTTIGLIGLLIVLSYYTR